MRSSLRRQCKADYQHGDSRPTSLSTRCCGDWNSRATCMHELIDHCEARGIGFFSTAFDIASVDLLVDLGLDRFKIPSARSPTCPTCGTLAARATRRSCPPEWPRSARSRRRSRFWRAAGTSRPAITVLHCTTEYPTPMEDVNLRAMLTIRDRLRRRRWVTRIIRWASRSPIAAVALGATVIEKHFTLDRRLPGPDHQASLEPAELAGHGERPSAISNARSAMASSGRAPARRRTCRLRASPVAASQQSAAGESIHAREPSDRQATGHRASRRCGGTRCIGRAAPRDFAADEPIEL